MLQNSRQEKSFKIFLHTHTHWNINSSDAFFLSFFKILFSLFFPCTFSDLSLHSLNYTNIFPSNLNIYFLFINYRCAKTFFFQHTSKCTWDTFSRRVIYSTDCPPGSWQVHLHLPLRCYPSRRQRNPGWCFHDKLRARQTPWECCHVSFINQSNVRGRRVQTGRRQPNGFFRLLILGVRWGIPKQFLTQFLTTVRKKRCHVFFEEQNSYRQGFGWDKHTFARLLNNTL